MEEFHKKAYVVSVNMGYGHQRAVFPLLNIAIAPDSWNIKESYIISANNYPTIPRSDKNKWYYTRKIYENISRIHGFPFFGKMIFNLMSYVQKIEPFYPRRDLSRSTISLGFIYKMINRGFGKHLIDTLNKEPLPFISSFPIPAFCAEEHGYKGKIYCLCTDTDIARAWAPLNPGKSRIIYLTPTLRAKERLKLYGVKTENIIVTGFPLPREALGKDSSHQILIDSLRRRITKLDPNGIYRKKNEHLISSCIGFRDTINYKSSELLTITFAIGGAGAQSNIALKILNSFKEDIQHGKIRFNLVAGTSIKIKNKFERAISELSLESYRNRYIKIIYNTNKYEYFREFNSILSETDILWTKPSELSFYSGLGLPIIMSPTLGSQEECNRDWLHMTGSGFEEYDPRYAHEWVFDWINSGWLAEAAMNGFLNISRNANNNIEDVLLRNKRSEIEDVYFV